MADHTDATTQSDPQSTSIADGNTASPVAPASTKPSPVPKGAVEDASLASVGVKDGNEEAPAEDAASGSNHGSAAQNDGENPLATDESDEKSKEDAPAGLDQAIQKNGSAGYGNERPRKRLRESNVRSDLTSQPESKDPVAIRKQVEFYFADSNLPMDQFLFSKVQGHANLPVPIETIASFKRMRHFKPFSAIVEALKESEVLDVVDNDTAIKRKVPLPETVVQGKSHREVQKIYEDKTMPRSVYVKGFGRETRTTQFDIEAFFAPYGPVNSVRLRRTEDKSFKGSVFVEFNSEDTAKAFLALDPKPKWEGNNLMIKSKKQYCDDKVDDINQGRVQPHRDSKRPRWDDRDDRSWKDRRDEDAKRGFDRSRYNKGNGYRGDRGRGRGRGGRGGRGGGRQTDNRGVPVVATTTEDPVAEAKSAPDTAGATNGAAALKVETGTSNKSAPDTTKSTHGEAVTKVDSETSKKRSREADDTTEVNTEV